MSETTEVKLPSGAILRVQLAPFEAAKTLYQAMLKEIRGIEIKTDSEFADLYKNIFCSAFASQEVERALKECFKRCTIDNLKIDENTFEPAARRADYTAVCIEVGKLNVSPFVKSLYAEYQQLSATIEQNLA